MRVSFPPLSPERGLRALPRARTPRSVSLVPTWSDDWADGWKSNLPDAYRDDLTSDDEYKKFAVGRREWEALKYKKYFAWYNTDDDGSNTGTVLEEGQRTARPRNFKQRSYCTGRGGGDKYCFFENGTNVIQEYPIENRYHRVRKSWP